MVLQFGVPLLPLEANQTGDGGAGLDWVHSVPLLRLVIEIPWLQWEWGRFNTHALISEGQAGTVCTAVPSHTLASREKQRGMLSVRLGSRSWWSWRWCWV